MKLSFSNILQLVTIAVVVGMSLQTLSTGIDRLDKMEAQMLLWLQDSEKSQRDIFTAIKLQQKQLNHLQAFLMKEYPGYVPPSTNPAFYYPDFNFRKNIIK